MKSPRQMMKEIFKTIKDEKILLHSCCAPCGSRAISYIQELSQESVLECYFYNPNIMPRDEYFLRAAEMEKLARIFNVPLKICDYNNDEFLSIARGLENEKEGGIRCGHCINLRLLRTAYEAKERNFDYFCTTLTVSPHKNAPLINEIGFKIADFMGVQYLPSDFKQNGGYQKSIELSKEYSLYRQNYCGCRL